jgi:hypothetical protein
MPKVKITTDRQPWANEAPHPLDAVIETDKETADGLIEKGFAEPVTTKKAAE